MGTLTSCNPLGHSRPITGMLYLYLYKGDRFIRDILQLYLLSGSYLRSLFAVLYKVEMELLNFGETGGLNYMSIIQGHRKRWNGFETAIS
jgi:hypothetical protein